MGQRGLSFTIAPKSLARPLGFLSFSLDRTGLRRDRSVGRTRRPVATAPTDLVALVDAVDELRVRGDPCKTDGGGVDRFGLDVAGGDSWHCDGDKKTKNKR